MDLPLLSPDQHCDLGGSFVGTLGLGPVEPLLSCRGRSWGSLQISTLSSPRRLVRAELRFPELILRLNWLQHPLPPTGGY